MIVTLGGRRYRLVWVDRHESPRLSCGERLKHTEHGACEPPDVPRKRVLVRRGLSEEKTLDTLLHEALHACAFTVASEEWVSTTASELARILTRLGYRRGVRAEPDTGQPQR